MKLLSQKSTFMAVIFLFFVKIGPEWLFDYKRLSTPKLVNLRVENISAWLGPIGKMITGSNSVV